MSIKYTYEVVSVNSDVHVMDIIYRAEGFPDTTVGARLPYVGETVEDVAKIFSPVAFWEQSTQEFYTPDVGTSGEVDPSVIEVDSGVQDPWAEVLFEQRLAKALMKFGLLSSDPTAIESTTL